MNNPDSKDNKPNYQQKKNKRILEKVKLWQSFKYVKPLTCQASGCGEKLVPKETKFKVILQCPKCGASQPYVPKAVIDADLCIPGVLERNRSRHSSHEGDDGDES